MEDTVKEGLPRFTYHPDPVATGAIVPSDASCRSCGRPRGYVYARMPYSQEEDLEGTICPWCIADGTASQRFDAEFTSVHPRDAKRWDPAIIDELLHRTPGFESWQDAFWIFHCSDACEFRGDLPAERLAALSADDRAAIMAKLPVDWTWDSIAGAYSPGGEPAIYWFVCRHCQRDLFDADFA